MKGDTDPDAGARYAARLRALGPAERLAIVAGLDRGVRTLAEAGIRERHPNAGDDEVRCRLAVRIYGREVARRIFGVLPPDVP